MTLYRDVLPVLPVFPASCLSPNYELRGHRESAVRPDIR
jgi:hypothetical protein